MSHQLHRDYFMAMLEFIEQLRKEGYESIEHSNGRVYFEYLVGVGKNIGKKVFIGFENLHDFPMNCPHGPHFKEIDEGWITPDKGVHASNFGIEWKHWSRPFNEWNQTKKTVKEYLSHIKNILMSL